MGAMRAWVLTTLVLIAASATAQTGSENGSTTEAKEKDRIEFDFSFDYDPAELREHWAEKVQITRIWGPVGLAGYHIFPAAESGPWARPPTRIWTNGFGTSLWRDPITGWPEQ